MPIPPNFPYARGPHPESFDSFASVIIAPGVTTEITAFLIPGNVKQAFVTLFGHGIDNVAFWTTTIWRITRNSGGILYYSDIRDQLAEFTDPKEIGPIVLHAGDRVAITAQNNGAGSALFAARFRGFLDF